LLRSDSESDSDSKLESKVNQNSIKEVISIQNQIIVENWINQLCFNIQIVMKQNRRTCQDIDLNNCRVLDEVLWKDDRLWVFQSIITWLIREAHDLSINDHSDMNWTLDLLRQSYCWSKMRTMIKRYIQNCYVCRRSKASRDRINELLKSLLILKQRWQNIFLNFIINLLESDESNAYDFFFNHTRFDTPGGLCKSYILFAVAVNSSRRRSAGVHLLWYPWYRKSSIRGIYRSKEIRVARVVPSPETDLVARWIEPCVLLR